MRKRQQEINEIIGKEKENNIITGGMKRRKEKKREK